MATRYDAIVIGTGQSGPPLAARLADEGMKIAVIERKRFGGTCVNVGCMPTKTLVASARAAYIARRAADFGVEDRRRGRGRHGEGEGAQGRDRRAAAPRAIAKWMRSTENVHRLSKAMPASRRRRRCG